MDLGPGPGPTGAPADRLGEESPYGADPVDSSGSQPNAYVPPGGRRGLVAVGIVALVAAAILVMEVASPSKHGPRGPALPAAVRALGGRVVAEDPNGILYLSHPDGSHSTVLRAGPFEDGDQPAVVDTDRAVVALRGGRLAESRDVLAGALPPGTSVVARDPFSNGAKAVVVTAKDPPPTMGSVVSVVTLADHHTVSLGAADGAAGDPRALGAFVTVAATHQPGGLPPTGLNGLADTQVDLRDSGRPAELLATAAQLDGYVDQNPGEPVNLSVFPDHDGGKVAVMINPIGEEETNSPMVILDRHGQVLGAVGSAAGPTEYTAPYWSPDDTSLAYATFGSVGTSLAVLNGSNHIAVQALQPTSSIGACAWSPDSTWVACLATSPSIDGWLLARNDDSLTPISTVPGRGTPLLWIR